MPPSAKVLHLTDVPVRHLESWQHKVSTSRANAWIKCLIDGPGVKLVSRVDGPHWQLRNGALIEKW